MKPDRDPHEELEQLVTRALRDQPLRHAPGTLESRVLAQIGRHAVWSRWRKGFAHWPLAARVAFFVASVGFVKAALLVGTWLTAPLDSPVSVLDLPPQVAWVQTLLVVTATVVHSVPALWLHAGIVILAIMYAALFGIGASAYRTLRVPLTEMKS